MRFSQVVPFGGESPRSEQQSENPKAMQAGGEDIDPEMDMRPSSAWDQRTDAASYMDLGKLRGYRRCVEGAFLVLLAIADNALSYVTYFDVPAFRDRVYNVVDLELALVPGLDIALLVFAGLGTATFLMMVVLVECNRLPLFHEMMTFRLLCSAFPCGAVCAVVLYYTETKEWAPFATLMIILVLIASWCLHMRVHYWREVSLPNKIILDVSWFFALVFAVFLLVLYMADGFKIISKSEKMSCPFAENVMMPVHVISLDQWYCTKWDVNRSTMIVRAPVSSGTVVLTCADTFVGVFGVSIEPHKVSCPNGCLRNYQASAVTGCGVYSVDSPICLSAIHAGVLTDQGGEATVYGRVGVPIFQRCSQNSIVSTERPVVEVDQIVTVTQPIGGYSTFFTSGGTGGGRRLSLVTAPLVRDKQGVEIPQAFHFNNMDNTREFIWLKRWEQVSPKNPDVEAGKPWTRIQAVMSMRMAGIELTDEKVRLGGYPPQSLDGPGRPSGQDGFMGICRVQMTGLVCQGRSSGIAQLDFCRPEVKSCLG